MTRKEQEGKQRQEILSTALDIFIKKDYTATKIQDIAEAAGLSDNLPLIYFESKEKLYEELIKIAKTQSITILDSIEGEPLEFFRTAARHVVQHVKTEPYSAKMFVLLLLAKNNEAVPESVKKLLADNDAFDFSVEKIKHGQQNLSIKEGNPVTLALIFWGALQGMVEQMLTNSDFSISDIEWIINLIKRE